MVGYWFRGAVSVVLFAPFVVSVVIGFAGLRGQGCRRGLGSPFSLPGSAGLGRGPGLFRLAPVLVPDRRRRCRLSPGGCRVILRQLRALDPAAGLLVVLVVVVALAVLFFARGPLCPGPVRCAVPGPAAGCRRRGPAAGRRYGSPPGSSCLPVWAGGRSGSRPPLCIPC